MTFTNCPRCGKKSWYRPTGAAHRARRCRLCGHDNRVQLAEDALQKTLDRGHAKVRRALDRNKGDDNG
jgi:hypothetical protein